MRQKIFLLFALLCAAAQGAWADDGWSSASSYDKDSDADKPTHYDTYGGRSDVHVIKTAANYLYVMDKPAYYCNKNIYLDINVDVSSKTWTNLDNNILGVHRYLESGGSGYRGTFYGNGHTIRINLDYESYSSYKGPFGIIAEGGKVQDLNVEGTIYLKKMDDGNGTDLVGGICGENNGTIENCSVSASVSSEENYLGGITGRNTGTGTISNCRVSGNVSSNSRLVGGIAGENNGTISNCWVSGNVSSDWKNSSVAATAKVGGIAGENNSTVEYCCMTGNVSNDDADVGGLVGCNDGTLSHCTFYGTRHSSHDQASIYVGKYGTEEYLFGIFSLDEYNAASGKDMYRHAIRYTYDVTVNIEGHGTVRTRALDEDDVPGTCAGQTFSLNVTSGTALNVTVTDADGNNVPLQGHANDNSSFWFVMPSKNVTATVTFGYTDWPTQGAGTVDDPYIISSAEDWNDFAYNVRIGRSYSGQCVKLTSDISVSTMAGAYQADDNYHPFSGTFDGDGHTLTINVSNQSRFAAPFKCVNGATIKNLRTAGTISGTGNADGKLLAGIVGVSFGSTTITNCRSSVTLTTNFGEDAAMAGIVAGTKGGSLTIAGCVFDGTMTGSTNTRCAGIAGYEYIATTTAISNTLFAPTTLTVSTTDDTFTKTFSRDDDATITNCYYTKVLGAAQGTLAMRTATAPSAIGSEVQDYGMVTAYENGLLFGGKYYYATATSVGCFTEASPHIISSTDDWNDFVHNVGIGYNYSGQYVQLAADISVTTMAGSSFSGTFDGGDHTITANISGTGSKALFNRIDGGTIQNLKLAGNVSGGIHTAALVVSLGNSGANLIQNCVVSANVTCSSSHMGGFLAHGNTSNITINCCVFSGKMTGGSSAKGVFYGWGDASGTSRVTNCLYLMADGQDLTGLDLVHLNGATTLVDRCYKNTATGSYGTQATVSTEAPGCSGNLMYDCSIVKAYQGAILYGGNYYYDNHALYNHGGYDPGNPYYNFVSSNPNTRTVFTVYSDITWSNRMIIQNDVVIYLAEGATLHAQKGIEVSTLRQGYPMNSNLTIDGPGTLIIDGCYDGKSGIGAQFLGSITINGGTINVKGGGAGAGIGSDSEPGSGGTITINGGIINATGGTYDWRPNGVLFYRGGAGIGDGAFSTQGINVTINGGVVNARGGFYASGIGGGAGNDGTDQGKCGTITINGGQVTAIGGEDAPGIGPGYVYGNGHQASGTLTLSWTNQYEDFVSSSQFRDLQSISFATGKQFLIDGTSTIATSDNIGGQGIRLVPYVTEPVTLTGAGTAENPWRITCTEDWNKLVYNVNAGNSYSGQYVQLDVDIDITRGMGVYNENPDSAHPFSGTFLGNNKTITATITDYNQGAAPFHYINGATIRDLHMAGTITSSQQHAAALVGFSDGTGNSIENCVVTADVSGNEYVGGIVGHALNSSISLSGCAFSGLMTGGSNYMGAFIGWDDGGTKTATDCLYLIPVGQSTTNLDLVKEGGTLTVTNCCKTTYVGNYGMYAVYATTPSDLGALTHDYGMVKAYEGGILFDGKYYLATFPGTGTEADPYIIRDEDDWNAFAYYVNNGHNFNGKFVKLTNNISVTTMVGSSENISFQGTFLGNNQTLTFTKGSAEAAFSEENCAPFRFVKDATIQDLKVAGNIYTSRKFAVGLASRPYGTTNITNCHVSTNIYSTVNGDGTHGGFAAMPSGTLNIAGCAYTGRLLTNSGTNNCGGFVAWHNSATISVASSLYAPSGSIAEGWTAITGGETFVRGGSPTITDCYYTEPMGTAQGTQAYALATAPANLGSEVQNYGTLTAYENGILYDGKYYAAPATISLANAEDNSTTINDADGYVANVTLAARTLYKDGAWNTICLPFDVALDGSPLEGAEARTLTSGSIEGTTLNLNFGDAVTTLKAGTPYIIKWTKADDYVDDNEHNIVSPVFSGVTIDADADGNYDNGVSGDERVRFLGTYKSTAFDAEDKSILLMGGENTLYYPTAGAGIGAQRAYFKIGSDGALLARRLTAFNIDFGDDEATGIISTTNDTNDTNSDAWFTLDGRRLQGQPTAKGLYIVNGKKVIVK